MRSDQVQDEFAFIVGNASSAAAGSSFNEPNSCLYLSPRRIPELRPDFAHQTLGAFRFPSID